MLAAVGGSSYAQQQSETQLDRVVVTGSMIPRTMSETTEAMTVIKAESLKDMGITTVEQALALVSSNQPGVITASAVSSWGTGGGSFASLRGLGASKTLVLLDGQRLANNVVLGSAVDLNGIPFAAIERIEIVREGASSVYGTDAMAGVINFITKKSLQGGQLNVNGSRSQGGGGNTAGGDIAWGTGSLDKDGYNLLVTANYSKINEMKASQRSFAATGWYPSKGLSNQNGPMGTFPGSYTDANGNIFQVGYPACAGNPYLTKDQGNCAYLYSAAVDLIPPQTMWSGMVSFTKALPGDHTLNLQYFYASSKVSNWGGPQTYSFTMTPATNPTYFPTLANSTYVTGNGAAPPDLVDPITVGWTDPNNNRYQGDNNTEQRFVASLKGTVKGWDYSAAANYSVNNNALLVTGGYADYNKLAPGGILSDSINPFGPLSAQGQALIDGSYLNGKLASGKLSLWDVNLQASREVGDLFGSGKQATLALGVDARQEKIGFNPTDLATTLYNATYYPPAVVTGSRNSQAIYAEFDMPLTKEWDLTLSDRHDRYSDFGNTNNAKLSALYQPSKLVSFRAAALTGFRAPSLVDLFSPQVLGAAAGSMTGPGCASGNYDAIFTQANCAAQGMALSGGNPNLKPEKSTNYSFGIILAPVADLGITLDLFHIKISNEIQSIPDTVIYANPGQFSSLYKLNNLGSLTQAPVANTSCPNGPSSPTCGYVIQTVQNTGGIITSGADLSANYQMRTAVGKFRFGLEGTWTRSYLLQEYAGGQWLNLLGQFNGGNQPAIRWQHQLSVDWTNGDWGAGLTNHYTASYADEFKDAANQTIRVGSYAVWGAYASWKPMPAMKLLVGVRNLLNTNPPFSNQTQNWQSGYNPVFSDPTGRAWYLRATYDF
ncbi:TonB-dependent receptor plug domain-containing protein [Roseateles saccharophilus]|uniref:Iron complex outermembrane receptor protein n=1 Tax=Roseateles saccharophilus TaxID=304 RepID=A0A4R3VMB6_ROSSA|nr:TonB-dependent receptor [Roseateles saccharophilus]TCV04285.1 iron complex outermembrane receptor protein [Roseateles saccharophilus]